MAQKAAINSIKEWYPAIYARLSDEDSRAGVSLSIEHQLEILRRYVKENGWHTPKVFYEACDIIEPNPGSRADTGFQGIWFILYYA